MQPPEGAGVVEIGGSPVLDGSAERPDLGVNLFNSVFFWPFETCDFLFPGRGDSDDPFLPFVEGVPMALAAWASCPKVPLDSSEHVRLGFESCHRGAPAVFVRASH